MIDREHKLPITKQAEVLNIGRGSVYYLPRPVPEGDLAIMRRMDEPRMNHPFAGARMLCGLLNGEGFGIGRKHVDTLMRNNRQTSKQSPGRSASQEPFGSFWRDQGYAPGLQGDVSSG